MIKKGGKEQLRARSGEGRGPPETNIKSTYLEVEKRRHEFDWEKSG